MITQNDIKELFDRIDNFAQQHQKEIFELNKEKDSSGKELAEYTCTRLYEDCISLIYDEYWRYGGHEKYRFDIPLKYMNNLEGWLEDLQEKKGEKEKEKEAKEMRGLQEKINNSLGAGI